MKKIILSTLASIFFITGMAYGETVVYNPNTGIYHSVNCHSAAICKVCIKIDKKEAQRRGGRACKKCGG